MKIINSKFLCALILGSLLISGCQMEDQPAKIGEISAASQSTPADTEIPDEVIYNIGDIIRIDQTILVVLGWDQPPGGDLNPPDQGKKYLVVDLMIANQGDRSFSVSPAFQMTLKSPDGQKYNVNGKANLASGSNPPNGEINPGEMIRGKVGFQVPQELVNATFVYEVRLIGLGEVSVNLGATPIALDPPQDLNLVNQQKVFNISDIIDISGFSIQVLNVEYPSGTDFVKPKQGYKFIGVDVQVENISESIQEISSIAQMYIKDSTGQKYTFHLGAQSVLEGGLPDDELQPGEIVRGQIGFQVPDSAQGLVFVFDAEIFGLGKAFIALNE
jgi:hypothetical protein